MNKAKFDALSPELQNAMIEAAKEAGQYQRDLNVKNEKEIITNLQKQGIEVIEKVDTQPFQAVIAEQVRKSFVEKHGDALLKQVDALAQ